LSPNFDKIKTPRPRAVLQFRGLHITVAQLSLQTSMKDELVRKIQGVLDRRITNEKQVVYLLVEIRKLMDRDKYKDPVLRTFINWVVHTSLELPHEGSTFILTEFDQWLIDLYDHKKKSPHPKHISLVAFRHSLVDCIAHFGQKVTFVHDVVA
jgi:hypothetical protein